MSVNKTPFTRTEDDKLVEMVRDSPLIYDVNNKYYKNQSIRDKVWTDISDKVGRNVDDCKKRWRSIRDTFSRNNRRQKLTGSSTKSRPSKWALADQLTFLNNLEPESTTKIVESTPEWEDSLEAPNDVSEIPSTLFDNSLEDSPSFIENITTIYETKDIMEETLTNNIKRKRLPENIECKPTSTRHEYDEDAVDIFFKSMALTVKNLPAPLIAEAKMKICSIVTDLELRFLQENTPTDYDDIGVKMERI